MNAYRTPDERFEDLPEFDFAPNYLDQDGLRLHYLDEGSGAPILLLHGEPTWSFLYRKLIPTLRRGSRCIAPDYFGFGRSDKPTDRQWYSYDRHYTSIERLVRALDLRDLTVVVQDWGGPIGFRLCVSDPDRIARLVVLNTGIGAQAPNDEWLRFQAFMRRVGTDIVAGQLVRLSLVQPVADEVIAGYDAPFPVPEARVGIAMFPELVATSSSHAVRTRDARRARAAAHIRPTCTRPLLGQRPDLRPRSSRGDGRAAAERRARSAARRRRSLPAGGPRRADRRADRSLAGTLDQPLTRGVRSCGGPRRLRELAQDVRDVPVDRVLRQDERGRDLAVAHPGRDETEDLGLARCERRLTVGFSDDVAVKEPGERALQLPLIVAPRQVRVAGERHEARAREATLRAHDRARSARSDRLGDEEPAPAR